MPVPDLGPAMQLALVLAQARKRGQTSTGAPSPAEALWGLAERYHPEQVWLAASWACGDRTLDEIRARAPRESLARPVSEAFARLLYSAQDLRAPHAVAQK